MGSQLYQDWAISLRSVPVLGHFPPPWALSELLEFWFDHESLFSQFLIWSRQGGWEQFVFKISASVMRADDSSPVYFHPLGRNGNSQNCFRVQGNRRLKSLSVTLRRAVQVATSATGLPSLQDSLTLSICLSCPVSKNSFPNFRLPSCLSIHKAKRT